ncbi:MAG TPA: GNAT family protein [Coleofasciculaceae cyanobacterium]
MFSLRLLQLADAQQLAEYYRKNELFHRPWSPLMPAGFTTAHVQQQRLQSYLHRHARHEEYRFGIFTHPTPVLIGIITLSAVERQPFQNGRLGYSIDEHYQNRGILTEYLKQVMEYAFKELDLHRLEANIMPRNGASRRVLEKCGFRKIGYSPKYLKIQNQWEDHEMYMALAEEVIDLQNRTCITGL